MHRILMNKGFTLRRRGLSTDTLASWIIGSTTTAWTITALLHTLATYRHISNEPSQPSHQQATLHALATLANAPLLLQCLFTFWLISYLDGLNAEHNTTKPHFFSLTNLHGPFSWSTAIHRPFHHALLLTTTLTVTIPALATITLGDPLPGILSLTSLLLFTLDGASHNPYTTAPHRYTSDRLRIALPTTHHEGTMYILPSTGTGISAVWSPKIANEHADADRVIMPLFAQMRSQRWSVSVPLEALRTTMSRYHERVLLSATESERLAAWIYNDKTNPHDEPSLRRIECARSQNVHLIGRDLMFALCHAEYLVFMAQGRLSERTRAKLGMLRLMSRSGASTNTTNPSPSESDPEPHTIGFTPGFAGYKAAVTHIYAIFDVPVDALALDFAGTTPPPYPSALSSSPTSINEYVAQLWDLSTSNTESTFSALYFFTTVWFMEVGNVNGFHIFPLRCRNREGDLVSWQIAWRQAWWVGVVAQLVGVSPALFGVFVMGYLQ